VRAGAVALLAALLAIPALAASGPHPECDPLVRPDQLSTHSRHPWKAGIGIWIPGDKLACNYYQDEAVAGLSLSVRPDAKKEEFQSARLRYANTAQSVGGLGDEAFYFRLDASAPFQPSWGLVVYAKQQTYRLEGVPEAGKADAARGYARDLIVRTMQKF
jgi:endonuclease YncB( thermonuclease family)